MICSIDAAGRGDVVLERDALGELLGGLLEDRADAPVHHDGGHLDRGLLGDGVDRHAPEELVHLRGGGRLEAALEVGAQLVERVELADLERQVVARARAAPSPAPA